MDFIIPNGTTTTCQLLDWTNYNGELEVDGGTFIANDLEENGLYGKYYLTSNGGLLELHQDASQYVDLDGQIVISNGTMNIYGGNGYSYWPYAADATINMFGGILDFKNVGITIYNSATYMLNDNLLGGVIRTVQGLNGGRSDFTPTAGTFEFYGGGDWSIIQAAGSLFNVNINKSAKDGLDPGLSVVNQSAIDERSGMMIGGGGKANSISLGSNFTITNNLTITAGSFVLNGFQANVINDCQVYGTLTMNSAADVLNLGNDYFDWLEFSSGSTANLTAGTINLYGWIIPYEGSNFLATTGNTIFLKGNSGGGLSNFEPTAVYGNIVVDKNAGQIAYLDGSASQPINVSGTFTMNANTIFEMQDESMYVNGILTDVPTSEIRVCDVFKDALSPGSSSIKPSSDQNSISAAPAPVENGAKGGFLDIDTDFTLNGLMDVRDGNVLLHGIFHLASTGNLNITSGSFIADGPLFAKNWEYIDGHLGLTSGLFEISNNSIRFSATGTSTVSGGIIRSGEAFAAQNPGTFEPSGGTVEIVGVGSNTIYCQNGNYFYNLLINRDPAASSYLYTDITVKNNLTILSGKLNSYDGGFVQYNIYIGGNWTNNIGPTGFGEGTGTVYFNGDGATLTQFINGNESFYNVTNAITSGGNLRFNGNIDITTTSLLTVQILLTDQRWILIISCFPPEH